MKLRNLLYLFILLLFSCYEHVRDDLAGNAVIVGQLQYQDLYSGNGEKVILGNRKVCISYGNGDSVNYLYYVITDANGNFNFTRLLYNSDYLVFFADTVNGKKYAVYQKLTVSYDTLRLIAQNDIRNQNGMAFCILDANHEPLKGVDIGLFNNLETFKSDSSNKQSLDSQKTDQYGRAMFYNYKAGQYYVRVISRDNHMDTAVNFSGDGIRQDTIIFRTATPVKNTLLIRTLDESGNLVPGISGCLYNNPLLFDLDTCSAGKLQDIGTSKDGTVKINNLAAGKYYIFATTEANKDTYKGKANFTITESGQTTVDIVLKKVTPERELEVTTLDVDGTPVNGTELYFFSSRVLFSADTTLGSIAHKSTGTNGKVTITDLDAGKYYIRAMVMLGEKLKLKGADSVVIPASGKVSKVITVK